MAIILPAAYVCRLSGASAGMIPQQICQSGLADMAMRLHVTLSKQQAEYKGLAI